MSEISVAELAEKIYQEVSGQAVLNISQMEAIFEGNQELMTQALDLFVASAQPFPGKIDEALASMNYEQLHRTVHQCKGSSGYLGAERVQTVSLKLQADSKALQKVAAAAAASGGAPVPPTKEVEAQAHALKRCLAEVLAELDALKERSSS